MAKIQTTELGALQVYCDHVANSSNLRLNVPSIRDPSTLALWTQQTETFPEFRSHFFFLCRILDSEKYPHIYMIGGLGQYMNLRL